MPLQTAKSSIFFSNTFFVFIIKFFPSLANLLVVVYYSRKLPQVVYGDYTHFWIHLNIIYPIACFGIHVFILTYSPAHIRSLIRQLKPGSYLLYTVWVVLSGSVFAWLQYNSLGISPIFSALILIAYSISFVLESLILAMRRYNILVIVNVLYSTVFFGVHWWVAHFGFSLNKLLTLLFIVVIVRLLVYLYAVYAGFRVVSVEVGDDPDINKAGRLLLHLGFYDISQNLFNWIDKFIISIVLTSGLSAIYYNGSMNIPFLPVLLSAAGSAVLIQLAHTHKDDERADAILLMNRTGRVLSCIVFPLFFYLLFFRYEMIECLFSAKYRLAIPVFAVAILVLPVRAYSFTTVLQKFHKGAIINAGGLLDLVVACLLMYPLYKMLGLPGVALGFVLSTYLQAGFYLYYTCRVLEVSMHSLVPLKNWILKFLVFGTAFVTIHYVAQIYLSGIITLILGGIATMISVIVSLYIENKFSVKA